jgi:hypothetical protein
MVWRTSPKFDRERAPTSVPDYLDWKREARGFTDLAVYTSGATATLLAGGTPQSIEGARVSGNLFRTLGVPAALGRAILDVDGEPGAEPAILLSDALWRRAFGADTAVVGRSSTSASSASAWSASCRQASPSPRRAPSSGARCRSTRGVESRRELPDRHRTPPPRHLVRRGAGRAGRDRRPHRRRESERCQRRRRRATRAAA